MAETVNQRARRRLARLRTKDDKSVPGVRPTARGNFKRNDRIAIRDAYKKLLAKEREDKNKPPPYDPLAPLTGENLDREIQAQEDLRFGPETTNINNAITQNNTTSQLSGSAHDQYAAAIAASRERIAAANAAAAKAQEGRVDSAYAQDKAAAEARDKAAADKATKLGLTVGPSDESARAVEAQRSQGNQRVADTRDKGNADNTYMENRGLTAIQGKQEAQAKLADKRAELQGALRNVDTQRGQFRVEARAKARDAEREWAAIQQEFGLKKEQIDNEKAQNASDAAAQIIVARIYAAANREQARAQIRVAKLQLEKGKITRRQYRHIINEYRGLPEKGTAPKPKGGGGSQGSGSGANGSLAPWEIDARDRAQIGFKKNKYSAADHDRAIEKAVQAGIPRRLAEAAWKRYLRSRATLNRPGTTSPSGPGSTESRPG